MGVLRVHEFMSLDGSIKEPTFTFDYPFTDEQGAATAAITNDAEAILLGRKTYVESGPAWSSRPDSEPGVTFFNQTPKHVVSGSNPATDWSNSSVLGSYDASAIAAFKESVATGIYVFGSGTLVRAMLADGLVDELHLFVYPVTVGDGPRLVDDRVPPMKLALNECEAYDNGVLHLTYTPQV